MIYLVDQRVELDALKLVCQEIACWLGTFVFHRIVWISCSISYLIVHFFSSLCFIHQCNRSIVPCGGFVDTIERINACSFVNTIPTYHIPTPIHPIPTRMMIHDISQEKKLNHQDRNNNPFHRQRSSLSPLPSLLSPPSSPTTIANGLFNMCDRMTDSTSMDSLLSIAAPIPNHKLIGGDSHQEDSRRESPKPLKKRPVNQHTDTAECSQSTDVEEHSSSDGNGTMSAQGKKRSHQNMSTTIDSMHGELGYFNLTLVR